MSSIDDRDDRDDQDGSEPDPNAIDRPEPTGSSATIKDLLAAGPTLSVEFFPPKTDDGMATLMRTVEELGPLELSYVSVTYGAAGNQETRGRTRNLVVDLNRDQPYPAMAHLTCMSHSRAELVQARSRTGGSMGSIGGGYHRCVTGLTASGERL